MRVLVTGASGFAGSHLIEILQTTFATTLELWGVDRGRNALPVWPGVQWRKVDLLDEQAVRALIGEVRPERIYHLAGQAHVGESWNNPWATFETNLRAQINLCEALLVEKVNVRLLVPGSMEEYGRVSAEDLPVKETQPLRPDSPYGVSKVAQDLLGQQYFLGRQLPIVRVRPFNHIGPRQHMRFVAPAFASQIAAIEAGRQPPVLKVGNLAARRDFTDVRDMMRAYVLALEQGEPGDVYNLGSGRSRSIQELLDTLVAAASVAVQVETDPARMRPADVPDIFCDTSKFVARTGWKPAIPFEQSLRDLLDYERQRLKQAATA